MTLDLARDLRLRGKLLDAGGAQGVNQSVNVDAAGLITFGNASAVPFINYFTDRDTVATNTSETAFVNYIDFDITGIVAGTYLIQWWYVWSLNGIADDIEVSVILDDTTELYVPNAGGLHVQEPKDAGGPDGGTGSGTNQRIPSAGASIQSLTGDVNIKIRFRTSDNPIIAAMYQATLVLVRLSA